MEKGVKGVKGKQCSVAGGQGCSCSQLIWVSEICNFWTVEMCCALLL